MSDEATVVVRPYDRKTDEACVYATWRNSAYYGSKISESKHRFFNKLTAEMNHIIPNATIEIACLKNDPNTIIGFVVSRGTHLDWIYVKVDYRKCGIATMLMPDGIETVTPHITKIGQAILNKKNISKEKDNGNTGNGTEAGA